MGGLSLGIALGLPRKAKPNSSGLVETEFNTSPFTLGVASGDPLPTAVVIWTRLAPNPFAPYGGNGNNPIAVEWEVFSDAKGLQRVQRGTSTALPEFGYSVHVDVTGLRPGTEYWYRFSCGHFSSPVGRTKTADPFAKEIRFGLASCNNYEHGFFTAFNLMARDRFDFIFHAGDYIYEKAPKGGTLRAHLGGTCTTLDDYRLRYSQYRLDPLMQAMHHSAPFIASWDDHEVSGNWADLHDKIGSPIEVFERQRRAAFQAYFEFMPLRVGWNASEPFPLSRSFLFGGETALTILDTRQFRSDQACNDANWGATCSQMNEPGRTMLGKAQERWLEERLAAHSNRWAIIGNQIPSYRRIVEQNNTAHFAMDKWDGYPEAQKRFHKMLMDHAAGQCLVLSGDLHAHYVSELRRDWGQATSVYGAEFTATSISSGGDGNAVDPLWEKLQASNPNLLYHSKHRGYVRCKVHADHLVGEFICLDRVSRPDSGAKVDARVRLDRGAGSLRVMTEKQPWAPFS